MFPAEIEKLLQSLLAGQISTAEAARELAAATSAPLENVVLDLDRKRRCGFPEVVYGAGKSAETIAKIFERQLADGIEPLATRVEPAAADFLKAKFEGLRHNAIARTVRVIRDANRPKHGRVVIITAGTTDLPVAEEAHETLDWMGVNTHIVADVGVAGPHRLPQRLGEILGADAIIVVAGMEAALPSVVGGYVDCPIFGVPTSVGYGANLGGMAALLTMVNSCSSNVAVVNIDAGFKGGYLAGLVALGRHKPSE